MTKDERREYLREWRKRNSDKARGYYEARKTKHIAYQRAWAKRNPEKVREAQANWRRANPERVSETQVKSKANQSDAQKLLNRVFARIHRFGLTLNQYLDLLVQQDFRCAVCGRVAADTHGSRQSLDGFVVDHDHTTNQVRGLLHPNCNVAIGMLRDDPAALRRAAKYLENNLGKESVPI